MRRLLAGISGALARPPGDIPALAKRYSRPSGAPTGRFLLLVGTLSIFGPLCIDMYLPALPTITRNLHASASEIQLSLTTCLIGLGVGQLLYGAYSDQIGRRRPLVVGLALFIAASICCAFAPDAAALALFRFLQGFGGAAGVVISRAIVRDLFEGAKAARVFSMLMLVTGCGPILAPQIGAALLTLTSWRGVFVALAAVGAVLLVIAIVRIPETLRLEYRGSGGPVKMARDIRRIALQPAFLQHAAAASLGFGAVFAYVAGASFVLENVYHASPQLFGTLFAINAVGLVGGSQLNGRIVGHFGAHRLLTVGLIGLAASTTALFVAIVTHTGGLSAVLVCMFATMVANGFIGPNATALALQDFPQVAGSASALFGTAQFCVGAITAPLVGIRGSDDAFPMALLMMTFGYGALTARVVLTRLVLRSRSRTPTSHLGDPVTVAGIAAVEPPARSG